MSESDTLKPTDSEFKLDITDAAAREVVALVEKHEMDPLRAGLRVGVNRGGCSGFTYDVRVEPEPRPEDSVVSVNDTRLFVDDSSAPYVSGMSVDWTSSMVESRFVFTNPNATGGCGCGESFSV